ncbi:MULTISPECIES: ABC transporter ATP-binding protein [Meiothermus]|uniref:ABC transporter ATP-binding protein n=2 Tax=Meiothermus hypogaeus TaxID=884155 RepID=A0A511QXM1_9DEIN|nr:MULTISPECIES: ABC transporter ATP-binding protein [Meiothermus]RIH80865.1 Oligopeptide transport ATP-binding protein OppD [Meiothermus hypogaeus]GEM82129.1 ABC transporter ATP-binding protein [Meiothermus hypogaeus NBRC 106114]GIW32938.1 MAG: ABC transporter ATP-binding protein [Meiothermus sp.]GIW37130.1 MAG: ABC transporter ATP-binding protein [Meiothermus sp.]
MDEKRLVDVTDLKVHFFTDDGVVKAVDGVSFHIDKGETLAVVGESGSGKSVASLAMMRLIPNPPGKIVGGQVLFRGKDGKTRDLVKEDEATMRKIRGNDIAMIFQEPMTSLNPVYTVGDQIAEAIVLHQGKSKKEALDQAAEMLDLVGIPEPKKRLSNYPHQMSGGMRQRVMIAMALSCNPSLLIADEPTTALDVTIQAQILELMNKLREEIGMSILFITHNLGVVAEMADRVVVMYAGRAVEEADVVPTFKKPLHPYTMGLLNSVPRLDLAATHQQRLEAIPGNVPNPLNLPQGCAFHPRCKFFKPGLCDQDIPVLQDAGNGHMVRCVRWAEIQKGEVVGA